MSVLIDTSVIHASYASMINLIEPGANIYDNPSQQGVIYPAWFIVHRSPVEIRRDVGKRFGGNRYDMTYQIDIWYMIQQNTTRMFDNYTKIAEQLDDKLEYLQVFGSDAVLHVFDKSWTLEMNALKFSTTLRFKVYSENSETKPNPMPDVIDIKTFLKIIKQTNSNQGK